MTFGDAYVAVRDYAIAAARTAWNVQKVYRGPESEIPTDFPYIRVWRSDDPIIENETSRTDTATLTFDIVLRQKVDSVRLDIDAEVIRIWDAILPVLNANNHPGGEGFLTQVTQLLEGIHVPAKDLMEVGVRWRVTVSFERGNG